MNLRSVGLCVLLNVLALAFGCQRERAERGAPAASQGPGASVAIPPGTAPGVAPSAPAAPSQLSVPAASEAEVSEFVAEWTKSQNSGDFAAYEALYAAKFKGVKRAGARVSEFDRRRWLADRAGMFAKPFVVQVSALSVLQVTGSSIANFRQTWRSAKFQDEGSKQLVLVRESGKLRIAREEMLNSKEVGDKPLLSVAFETAAIAFSLENSFVLFHTVPVDLNWVTDHPHYLADDLAERPVAGKALPAALQALAAARYEIFDASARRCELTPRGFKVIVRVTPHFGTTQYWDDVGAAAEHRRPNLVSPAQRAVELWGMAQLQPLGAGLRLGLEFAADPACPRPVWGRVKSATAAQPWVEQPATPEQSAEVARAVAKLPVLEEYSSQMRSMTAGDTWFERVGSTRIFDGAGGVHLIYAELFGYFECGVGVPGQEHVLWRQQKSGLVVEPRIQSLYPGLAAVIDLDGNGSVELITANGILARGPDGYVYVVDHEAPSFDCC